MTTLQLLNELLCRWWKALVVIGAIDAVMGLVNILSQDFLSGGLLVLIGLNAIAIGFASGLERTK